MKPGRESVPGFRLSKGMPHAPRVFRPHGQPSKRERDRRADERRGSARSRGYDGRWERARLLFLSEHPLCLGCEAVGVVEAATIVDHVVPHRGDMEAFWNESGWQACCAWHHDVVKQRLEAQYGQGRHRASALRLDSAEAVALTRRLRP